MQDPLSLIALPYRPSFGERRLTSDLARFSLDLSLVGSGPQKVAHPGPYPSPPMSGSSPQLPGSPYQSHQQSYPRFSGSGQAEVGDVVGRDSSGRRQQWDQRQQPPRPMAEAVNIPQYQPHPHADALSASQGQFSAAMPAQRSPFVAQAAFAPPRAPKRPKAHVLSACVNCKKAHLSCDVQRPCRRCIATNKEHSCVDVQHKKRGRPRLRDEREPRFDAFETGILSSHSSLRPPVISPLPSPTAVPTSYRSGTHRVLKSQSGGQSSAPRHLEHASLSDANVITSGLRGSTGYSAPTAEIQQYSRLAVAYLNMDFIIAKASRMFLDIVSPGVQNLVGKNLFDMIATADREKLYRLKRQIQEERDKREPAYLPPIYGESEIEAIKDVHEADIAGFTSGSQDRVEDLMFRSLDGRHSRFQIQLKLAKTTVFFAVLTVPALNYPAHQPPSFQAGQYRQPMMATSYGPPMASQPYGQPSQNPSFPSGPSAGSSPYYTHSSLNPMGSPHEDRPIQARPDTGYHHQMASYPPTSGAPPNMSGPQSTTTSSSAMHHPRSIYGESRQGPPRDLQLPPLRGVASGPRAESRLDGSEDNSGQGERLEGSRKKKRDRIAVEEMLE